MIQQKLNKFVTITNPMKNCFIFKPCKSDNSFKLVPQCKIEKDRLIQNILKEFNGKIIAETSFITIIEIGKPKITISKKGEIIVREVDQKEIEELSSRIMRLV